MQKTLNSHLMRILFICGSIIGFQIENYYFLLVSFSLFLLVVGATSRKLNERVFAIFFLGYLTLPFLNISEYRGTITIDTLGLYCLTQFCFLSVFSLFESPPRPQNQLSSIYRSETTELLFAAHLVAIYGAVAYVYATIGPIIIRQDLRFSISPSIEYLIKSGIVLPLFWIYTERRVGGKLRIIYRYLCPIVPSLLIGSRGTFIIIIAAIVLSIHLFKTHGPPDQAHKFRWIYPRFKLIVTSAIVIALLALYTGFYIRRDGNDLITAQDAIYQYNFSSDSILVKASLPLYMGLRETIGLTNRILEERIQNPTDTPLFYSELLTFLPGHQVAPGIVLAIDIYRAQGTDEKYSLTPGILGGIYLDFQYLFIPIVTFIGIVLLTLYSLGTKNLRWRIIYVLTVIQFFHLYHRGFLKLEYMVPVVVVSVYLLTLRSTKKQYLKPTPVCAES